MNVFFALVKRNMMVYYRDKGNVFFSILSMIIILGLMLIFLGDMNVEAVTQLLSQYGGVRDLVIDHDNARNLIVNWVVAGIIVVNSITIANAVVGIMISDEEEHKLSAFTISPVSRMIIVLAYITAAFVCSFLFCIATLLLAESYIIITGGIFLTLTDHLILTGYLFIVVLFSASLMFLLAQFVHSKSAYSGLSTVTGTLVGFLAAIYVPFGSLPEMAGNVLKMIPLFTATSLFRDLLTKDIMNATFSGMNVEVVKEYKEYMGITIYRGNIACTITDNLLFLGVSGLLCFIVSVLLMSRRRMKDR